MEIARKTVEELILRSSFMNIYGADNFPAPEALCAMYYAEGVRVALDALFGATIVEQYRRSIDGAKMREMFPDVTPRSIERDVQRIRVKVTDIATTLIGVRRKLTPLDDLIRMLTGDKR